MWDTAQGNRSRGRMDHIPQIVLGYRKAGKLTVTVRVSRAAQRALGRVKDARMSVGTIAVDVWKNQDSDHTKLKLKR